MREGKAYESGGRYGKASRLKVSDLYCGFLEEDLMILPDLIAGGTSKRVTKPTTL